MRLIDSIVSTHNINEAIYRVKSNKGAAGIDKMTADQVEIHFMLYKDSIIESILNKTYKPKVRKKSIYTEI